MRPRTFIALIALASVLTGLALVGVVAQSKPVPALTARDYVQIRQLVSRYAYALDTGGNNGYDFADLFTAGVGEDRCRRLGGFMGRAGSCLTAP